ncbi:Methyltransferase domain-containing protein [Streptomyces sp. DvalAA-14]|nr:Methyltransferase domain-containing protein [Streptomyces sp. DvalAA-14]
MTRPLVRRGFTVTAVDESAHMLERVHGARTVCGPIATLELDERFDVVLLASCLVHAADPGERRALLRTCRRYVARDGCVLIQREPEDAHQGLPREREIAGGLIRVVSSEPVGPGVRSVHVEYVFPDARWTQTFLSRPLTTRDFDSALAEEGLVVDTYLTGDRTWVRAVPAGPDGGRP